MTIPAARAMSHVREWSKPIHSGRISAWSSAIAIPMTASMEPTDRSMLRDTMTSTMPVAMMPTAAVCTERFHRLRGVRNVPSDQMWNPIQMTSRAASIPSRRVSISVARNSQPSVCLCESSVTSGGASGASVTATSCLRPVVNAHRAHDVRGRGACWSNDAHRAVPSRRRSPSRQRHPDTASLHRSSRRPARPAGCPA